MIRPIRIAVLIWLMLAVAGCKEEDRALIQATRKGDLRTVERLLKKGVDVNARSERDWTVLMEVAFEGHADVVKVLLDKGADPNAESRRGLTALMAAARNGHPDVVKLLKPRTIKDLNDVTP